MFALMAFYFSWTLRAAEPPKEVMDRLVYLVRTELETQSRANTGGMCSEEASFEMAERKLSLLEQSLTVANVNKVDKFGKLIEFFKDKMTYKCCQLSGKGGERKFKGGGGGGNKLKKRGRGGL